MPTLVAKHGEARHKRRLNRQARHRQARRYLATNNPVWRAIRLDHLEREPLCRHCKARGVVTPARDVDHINGRADREEDYQASNLQSLCGQCHKVKTRKEQQQ